MNITLTKEQEKFVKRQVKSGRYLDASDVMRDALRAMELQGMEEPPELEAAIIEGINSPRRPYSLATLDRIRRKSRHAK